MRRLPLFLAALSCTALAALSASANSHEAHEGHQHAEGSLHDSMESVNDAYRILGRGLRRPDASRVGEFTAAAETILKELTKAKEFIPERAMKLPEAEKQAMVEGFQADMTKAIETTKKLLETLKDGDLEAAAALAGDLRSQRNAAHDKYQEEEEEES